MTTQFLSEATAADYFQLLREYKSHNVLFIVTPTASQRPTHSSTDDDDEDEDPLESVIHRSCSIAWYLHMNLNNIK